MPAPSTPILDSFTRADENPLAGNWTDKISTSDGNLQVLSNQLANTAAARGTAWYNSNTFGPDCEAYITIPTLQASVDGIGLFLRVTNPGTASAAGYMCWYIQSLGFRIWKLTSGTTFTPLVGYANPGVLSAGDKIAFSAIGSSLKVAGLHSGVWTDYHSVTDSSFGGAGFIGVIGPADTTWRIDDFGGGGLFSDSVTVSGKTSISSTDIYQFGEAATLSTQTYISIVEDVFPSEGFVIY